MAPLALRWCPVTTDKVTATGSDHHLGVLPVCVQVPEQRRPSRVWALTDLRTHWLEWLSSACWPTCLQCTDRNGVNSTMAIWNFTNSTMCRVAMPKKPKDWLSAPPPAVPGEGNCHGPLEAGVSVNVRNSWSVTNWSCQYTLFGE